MNEREDDRMTRGGGEDDGWSEERGVRREEEREKSEGETESEKRGREGSN